MKTVWDIRLEAWHHELVHGFPKVYVMVKPLTGPVPVPFYLGDALVVGMPGQPICRCSDGHLFSYEALLEAWRYHDISAHYLRYGLAQENENVVTLMAKGG